LRGASGSVDQFGAAVSKSGGILGNVAGVAAGAAAVGVAALAAGVVAAGAAIGAAVTTAADFEQQMSAIKAVSGATGDEFASLRALAIDLGQKTAFSAIEAAQGIEELVKGGVSIKDIIGGGAAAAMTLAAAGGVSLAEAAKIAAISLSAFNLKGSDMAHVADIIAGAANASIISVGDFRLSMAQASASANMAGISFEDTATAIALLGKQGIVGADAGTSLKQLFNTLTPATKEQSKAMRKLGLITEDGKNQFFDAAGNMKSLAEISGILQKATAGLTREQKATAFEKIFGSDAIRAAETLSKAGAAGFNELAGDIAKIKAADVAAARLDNLKGSLEQLRGAWESLLITAGDKFLPVIRKIVDGLTDFIRRALDSGDAAAVFQIAADALDTFIGALTGNWAGDAASGINPIVLAFGQLGRFIREQVVPAFMALGNVVRLALSGDTQGAITAFFALVAGQQTRLVTTLMAWGQAFVNWITPFIPPLLAKLQEVVNSITTWIAANAPPLIEQFITQWAPAFVNWLTDAGEKALPHLTAFIDRITGWVQANGAPMLEAFIAHWTPQFVNWIGSAAQQIIPRLLQFQFEIIKWIATEGVPAFIQMGLDLGAAIVNGIVQALQTAADKIRAALIAAGVPLPNSGVNVPVIPPGVTQRPPVPTTPPPVAPTVADPATTAMMLAIKTEGQGVLESFRALKLAATDATLATSRLAPSMKSAAAQLVGPY
jgi:TP901 family phage tail tape measure protein